MTNYTLMKKQLISLMEGCNKPVSVLSNCAAMLWDQLETINWAGFYLLKDNILYLGPFQGKTACTMIPIGRGVCGTAVSTQQIQLVPDVHLFPGHIACDSASESEIVLPLFSEGKLIGVMDIDSPVKNRFTEVDAAGLSALCQVIESYADWQHGLL